MDKMTDSRAADAQVQGDRLAIKLLVAAGYVTEAKANEALNIAHGFDKGPLAPPSAPVVQPVAWSADKPGRPGVYGVRGFNLFRGPEEQFEAVVSVRLYEGDLICNLHEYTSEEDFGRWIRVEDCSNWFEWCEFVPAHPPPSAPVGMPAGWDIEVDGERVKVKKPDGAISEWHKRPATNGSGMYDLCMALAKQPAPSAPVGVEEIEAVLHGVYMDHPDSRLTTTMIHDMATAVVQSITQKPAACPACNDTGLIDESDDGQHGTRCYHAAQQPAAVDGAWQVQLADALECFWNPAIEGSGDDRSNIIGGMVQGFAAVAYRLREHAAQPGGAE